MHSPPANLLSFLTLLSLLWTQCFAQVSLSLGQSSSFRSKLGESIATSEQGAWNATVEPVEHLLRGITLGLVNTLESAESLLAGLVGQDGSFSSSATTTSASTWSSDAAPSFTLAEASDASSATTQPLSSSSTSTSTDTTPSTPRSVLQRRVRYPHRKHSRPRAAKHIASSERQLLDLSGSLSKGVSAEGGTTNVSSSDSLEPPASTSSANETALFESTASNGATTASSTGSAPTPEQTQTGDGEEVLNARRAPNDLEWFIQISVGTPPQSIAILPDTGSSDLIIFSSGCDGISPVNHTLYDHSDSHTYRNATFHWDGRYADGTGGAGWISSETLPVDISGSASTSLPFALVQDVIGGSFDQSAPTGVLGLAQDGLCTLNPICEEALQAGQGITLLSRLVKLGVLPEPLMSVKLVKSWTIAGIDVEDRLAAALEALGLSLPAPSTGEFLFGQIKDDDIVGGRDGLVWTPVTSHYYWGGSLDSVQMGLIPVSTWATNTNNRFIVDTGTTLIFTSSELAFYIHALILGSHLDSDSGLYYIPCITVWPEAPNLFFEIGGKTFGVPVSDLAWRPSSNPSLAGMCISGVQGGVSTFTVLGDMFIKNHYIVLSYGSGSEQGLQIGIGDRTDVPLIL